MRSRVNNYSGRFLIIKFFFVLGFVFLVARLFYIQIYQEEFIEKQVNSRTVLESILPAKRGKILDRNNRILALDVTGYSLILDLSLFNPNLTQIEAFSSILNIEKNKVRESLDKRRGYKELVRHIDEEKKIKIEKLNLNGVFFKQNLKRSYPQMEISSHVVGITDIDRKGIQGAELIFNKLLKGRDGVFLGLKSPIGVIGGQRNSPKDGLDLKLTIDIRLQSIAYHELKKAVESSGSLSGVIILVDPKKANILALTNFPSFNPSDRRNIKDLNVFRNKATVDVFQPGSVLKPLAMAAIIESGKIDNNLKINTSPGWIEFGGYKTSDFRDYGNLSLTEIISNSSNVGMVKLCKMQDPSHLISYFSSFGLGQLPSNILIPSREGFLPQASLFTERDKVSSCYGYGLSVTAVQIAQAYQVFANQGKFKELNLFYDKELTNPKPEKRILSENTTQYINSMLVEAVNSRKGTARRAKIDGIQVAGKTGTSEKIEKVGKSYTASFSGFAPAKDPKILGVIVLYDIKGEKHSGGLIAAPIFSKVISQSLHALESGST